MSLFSRSCTAAVDPHSSQKHFNVLFIPLSLNPPPPLLSSPSFPNTYPTPLSFFFSFFIPSCPLARSEVETCVSLHQ